MFTRRTILGFIAAATASAFLPAIAFAGNRVRFDGTAFDAALNAGKPVLIDISASWCPTCQRQKQILAELTAKPEFAGVIIFEVDYDTEKDIMRSFGAQQRSTLIAFKGGNEVGRVVGDTRVAAIEALLAGTV
jgi:thiol-disulfide isomerase/thioredoxin